MQYKIQQRDIDSSITYHMRASKLKLSGFKIPKINLDHYHRACQNLKIFCVYIRFFEAHDSGDKGAVYIGKTRKEPLTRSLSQSYYMEISGKYKNEFGNLFVAYSCMNSRNASIVEKKLIASFRNDTRWTVLNKSNGGEVGLSIEKAFHTKVCEKYIINIKIIAQSLRSKNLHDDNLLFEIMQSEKFLSISDCIHETALEWELYHKTIIGTYNRKINSEFSNIANFLNNINRGTLANLHNAGHMKYNFMIDDPRLNSFGEAFIKLHYDALRKDRTVVFQL